MLYIPLYCGTLSVNICGKYYLLMVKKFQLFKKCTASFLNLKVTWRGMILFVVNFLVINYNNLNTTHT